MKSITLPDNISIVEISKLKAWDIFRFKGEFWEMGAGRQIMWPCYGAVEDRKIVTDYMSRQKVAVQVKDKDFKFLED